MENVKSYRLKDICERLSSGKGITSDNIRENGLYPVYGGNGQRGFTDTKNFEGECAIIGRQGAYCGNVRYFSGDAYMSEHAIVAVAKPEHNTQYLAHVLDSLKLLRLSGQAAQPGLSVKQLGKLVINMPGLEYQNKVAGIIAEFDSLINLNYSCM